MAYLNRNWITSFAIFVHNKNDWTNKKLENVWWEYVWHLHSFRYLKLLRNCDLFERLFNTKLFSSTLKPYNWQALYPVITKKSPNGNWSQLLCFVLIQRPSMYMCIEIHIFEYRFIVENVVKCKTASELWMRI